MREPLRLEPGLTVAGRPRPLLRTVIVGLATAALVVTLASNDPSPVTDDESARRITWRDPNERRQSTAQLIEG